LPLAGPEEPQVDSIGKLYPSAGELGPGREHLTTAATMYREMGMPYWLATAEVKAGRSR